MKHWVKGLSGFVLLLGAGAAQAGDADVRCEALAKLALEHTEITSARSVSSGPRVFKMPLFGGIPWLSIPASCRVAATVRPVPGSEIRFEVWMPVEGWNGKFMAVGGGGLAGSIEYMSLALAIQGGWATASTDTGHQGGPGDGEWALNNPEKIVDYGHRGVHEMTTRAKKVIAAYYGKPAERHYFSSCSNGGRQGLMEAQRYPEDYDGIMAGAPALDGTGTLSSWGWDQDIIRAVPDGMELKNKLELIENASLAACDAIDGVKDGLIDDPRRCDFKPASLLCKAGQDEDECLSATQVDVLTKLYAGPGPLGGTPNPGLEPGGITDMGGWRDLFDGWWGKSGQYSYVLQFFRYLTYHDANWDFEKQFEFSKDRLEMQRRIGHLIDATNPDLSAYAARGGKLIIYHGWSDVALPARTTIHYYENLRQKMGAAADNAVQLYMAPGMQHCAMGPGPNAIGQMQFVEASPETNVHAALAQWVEKGVKPGPIIATKYENDIKGIFKPQASKAVRTRPLCPYPQVARYKGKGSIDEAANFECKAP